MLFVKKQKAVGVCKLKHVVYQNLRPQKIFCVFKSKNRFFFLLKQAASVDIKCCYIDKVNIIYSKDQSTIFKSTQA
jgi:hypothetical protein